MRFLRGEPDGAFLRAIASTLPATVAAYHAFASVVQNAATVDPIVPRVGFKLSVFVDVFAEEIARHVCGQRHARNIPVAGADLVAWDLDHVVIHADVEVVEAVRRRRVHNSRSCVGGHVVSGDHGVVGVQQRMRIDGALQREAGEIGENDGKRGAEERRERLHAVFHDQEVVVLGSFHDDVLRFGTHGEANVRGNRPGSGRKDELPFNTQSCRTACSG